ncbi:MAG: Uma2 family endonuclease [Dyadobacter sp.]|uniref:Uma2 family endonuclease n=1 Tax=Dyadobacter sp. TaxID=1914288 RepID=UPI003265CDA6
MKTMEAAIWYNPDLTQIINGEEIMSPSPKTPHQRASRKLLRILEDYVETNNLGELFNAPFDVIFEEGVNSLQPDLFFVAKQNEHIIQDWIRGVPDLVVEIISKSNFRLDTVVKKKIYERYGVKEFWIVFPEKASIEIYSLVNEKYELSGTFSDDEQVRSPLLASLSFKVNAII